MSVRTILSKILLAALAMEGAVQTLPAQSLSVDGSEYALAGSYLGDQTFPALAYTGNRGFVVWQDNNAGGRYSSIVARQLTTGFAADLSGAFRVNTQLGGDQTRPSVALLSGGGAAFVWEGGQQGKRKVYARYLAADGTFTAPEALVSQTGVESVDPAVVALPNGNLIILWSAFGLDGDLFGIFGRVFNSTGQAQGDIFQVNQLNTYNQRNASAAVQKDGRVLVTWVSEQQRSVASALSNFASSDIQARYLDLKGSPTAGEFRVNTEDRVCANPVVDATEAGGFTVAWTQRSAVRTNGWDVVATWYSSTATRTAGPLVVNTTVAGDQMLPSISSVGDRQLITWTGASAQRRDRTYIYAQAFRSAVKTDGELKVNSWSAGKQMHPVVGSDGISRFAVVWTSYVGERGFDLHAQRYSLAGGLPKPDAPFISNFGANTLQATWAPVLGYALTGYEIQFDGSAAVAQKQTVYTKKNLEPSSKHTFRLRYLLANGDASPWSDYGTGTVYGEDLNGDLIPDDWQARYWGADPSKWPSSAEDSDGDGATNAREFLAGTDPTDKSSVLKQTIHRNGPFVHLEWNTVPGTVYQVQTSQNTLIPVWANLGDPRLARSNSDSIQFQTEGKSAIYRVIRAQ